MGEFLIVWIAHVCQGYDKVAPLTFEELNLLLCDLNEVAVFDMLRIDF